MQSAGLIRVKHRETHLPNLDRVPYQVKINEPPYAACEEVAVMPARTGRSIRAGI